jgi:hypothetical protein
LIGNTDGEGRFSFLVPKAWRFRLNTHKDGFHDRGVAAEVGEIGDVTITTHRSISISVRWSDGTPAVAVPIGLGFLLGGQMRLMGGGLTDAKGEFRRTDLRPGRVIPYAFVPWQSTSKEKLRTSVPVYYPNMDLPVADFAIDLRKSVEAPPITLTLREAVGVNLQGTIRVPEGDLVYLMAEIGLKMPGMPGYGSGPKVAHDKPFQLAGLTPGRHKLLVTVDTRQGVRVAALEEITVLAEGNREIEIVIPPPPETAVLVEREAESQKREPVAKLAVSFSNLDIGNAGNLRALTSASGEMRVVGGVASVPYLLAVTGIPPDSYVAEISQGGTKVDAGKALVTLGAGPIKVLLRRGGTVRGVLSGETGLVVLAPKDLSAEQRFREATPNRDGRFEFLGVAPGEYSVLAFESNEGYWDFGFNYVEKFLKQAKKVIIAGGETVAVQLELAKFE